MRGNKIYNGDGWIAKELFGSDFYSSAGEHSYEDTVEIKLQVLGKERKLAMDVLINNMAVKQYLDWKGGFDGERYEYMFAYVPIGTAEDFCGSIATSMRNACKPVEKKDTLTRLDFQKMYLEFEDRYNKYPVQMSRCDAFGHAFRDGIISSEILHQAREFYGSLWNYTGD